MAGHGKTRHLKRIAAPTTMPIARKTTTWVKKHSPGAHSKMQSMPAVIVLREVLKVAGDAREAKKILNAGALLVDGRPVREPGFPVGLMDIVSIPKMHANYLVIIRKGKLCLAPIPGEESKKKLCKIVNKTIVAGGRIQLNFHDGRNYLIEKEEDQFKVGDTAKIAVPTQKLDGFLKLEKGATCYIWKGKHSGKIGTLEKIIEFAYGTPSDAVLKDSDGKELITLKEYLFVVDKSFKA